MAKFGRGGDVGLKLSPTMLIRSNLKFEKNKSNLMFNEICYNNDILSNYTKKQNIGKQRLHGRFMRNSMYLLNIVL